MKRIVIIGGVALAHVVVIWALVSGTGEESQSDNETGVSDKRPENAQEDVESTGKKTPSSEREVSKKSEAGGANGASKSTEKSGASGAEDEKPRFDPDQFETANYTLPPALKRKTNICDTGILVSLPEERILWQKNARKAVPIASLTKMMTALLLMERVENDSELSLETPVDVTNEAYRMGGSQVYLDPRERFTLVELLKCIMIFSANDAAYLVAQYLGDGDVDTFVTEMNKRAKQANLTASFVNPHGLPEDNGRKRNRATALSLAWMAERLLGYPEVVRWASTWRSSIREDSEKFDKFMLRNRNKLVRTCRGVNGMKTGYTDAAGFCVAATCKREGQTLLAVVTGCPSSGKRNELVAELFDWGYQRISRDRTANP